jgi:hypothetical protein
MHACSKGKNTVRCNFSLIPLDYSLIHLSILLVIYDWKSKVHNENEWQWEENF